MAAPSTTSPYATDHLTVFMNGKIGTGRPARQGVPGLTSGPMKRHIDSCPSPLPRPRPRPRDRTRPVRSLPACPHRGERPEIPILAMSRCRLAGGASPLPHASGASLPRLRAGYARDAVRARFGGRPGRSMNFVPWHGILPRPTQVACHPGARKGAMDTFSCLTNCFSSRLQAFPHVVSPCTRPRPLWRPRNGKLLANLLLRRPLRVAPTEVR
jgi:hypothetical protein